MKKQHKALVLIRQGNLGDHLCAVPTYISLKKQYGKLILITQKGKKSYAGAEELFAETDIFSSIFSLATPIYHINNIPPLLKILFSIWPGEAALVPDDLMTIKKKRYMQFFWSLILKKRTKSFKTVSRDDYRKLIRSKIKFNNQNNRLWQWMNEQFGDQGNLDPRLGQEFVSHLSSRAHQNFIRLLPSKFFVISAWSKDSIKTWPLDRFIEIAQKIYQGYGFVPIFVGSSENKKDFDSFQNRLSMVLGFFGSPMTDIAYLIKNARIVITNDSMASHFAGLSGTPCVSIFSGRTLPYIWWPDNKKGRVVQCRLKCEGCELRKIEGCRYNHKCIRQIKVSEILSQAEKLLKP